MPASHSRVSKIKAFTGETRCLRTSLRRASRAARSTMSFLSRRLLRSITSGMVTRCGKALERRLPTPRPDTCLIPPRCMRTEEGSRGLVEIRRFQKTEEGLRYLSDRRDHLPQEMEGDPSNFLADCGWDAVTILQRLSADTYLVAGPCRPDYPYLSGPKIGPLWLRMLSDNVGLSIQRFGRSANSRRCSHCTGLVGDRNRPG